MTANADTPTDAPHTGRRFAIASGIRPLAVVALIVVIVTLVLVPAFAGRPALQKLAYPNCLSEATNPRPFLRSFFFRWGWPSDGPQITRRENLVSYAALSRKSDIFSTMSHT